MPEEQKITNPIVDNNENLNQPIDPNINFETNPGVSTPEPENLDFSSIPTEVPPKENLATPTEIPQTPETLIEQNTPLEDNTPVENIPNNLEGNSNLSENLNSVEIPQPQNNEIILGKFDNPIISTPEPQKASESLDISLLEHPAILDNSPISKENTEEEQQKANLEQKVKLAQLIKTHESKAQKVGFTKGILSGVVLIIAILAISFIFAKDQILNILSNGEQPSLSANVTEIINTSDEEVISENEDITEDEEINNEESDTENEEGIIEDEEYNIENEEIIDENVIDNEINYEKSNTEDEELIKNEEIDNEEIPYEDEQIKETEEPLYKITHVTSVEEANWVLPAHCNDLTCYGEDKEFTPCTTFKPIENLDENANRIGNNGVCRYKNASELVYVEFN